MRTQFKSTNTLGEKHTAQLAATRWEGIEGWILGAIVVVGVSVLIWLLTRL